MHNWFSYSLYRYDRESSFIQFNTVKELNGIKWKLTFLFPVASRLCVVIS